MSNPTEMPLEISVKQTHELLNANKITLIDCREQAEYETARIEGAILIPLSEFGQRLDEVAKFRDEHIVIHCHHGGRSLQVTQALRSRGFSKVQNMSGGIDLWSREIDPEVTQY